MKEASRKLGIKPYLEISEYQALLNEGKIKKEVLDWVIKKSGLSSNDLDLEPPKKPDSKKRIRDLWKSQYEIDLITHVHPMFFRHVGHFLDQGISFSPVPFSDLGFWQALQDLERFSIFSLFKGKKLGLAHRLLSQDPWQAINEALQVLVGSEAFFETYLFEMVQEHPGWSGLVAVIEQKPEHLNFARKISFHEVLAFELLLELDYVETTMRKRKRNWSPLATLQGEAIKAVAEGLPKDEKTDLILSMFHSAWEWTYYRDLLTGIKSNRNSVKSAPVESQVFFCIDDRCCSLRRHLEEIHPGVETFGTPGFFGVEFWYQSEFDRFPVKVCPAPLSPEFLIRGVHSLGQKKQKDTDFLLSKLTHTLFGGWIVSQTLGLLSAIRLMLNIFTPTLSPKVAASFRHTDDRIHFKLERHTDDEVERGLKLGFTKDEMAVRVFGLLQSTGLTKNMAELVVMMGHGSSTVNNPHYAAYDCGACSGRPGSINARVFCRMANDPEVRERVKKMGIQIPENTLFLPQNSKPFWLHHFSHH